jgi:uncharacterized membrane protein
MQKPLIASALAAALALPAVSLATAGPAAAPSFAAEKCYGIAKAGANDCAGMSGGHSCAGMSKADGDPKDWIFVPKGYCSRIVGGMAK